MLGTYMVQYWERKLKFGDNGVKNTDILQRLQSNYGVNFTIMPPQLQGHRNVTEETFGKSLETY